MNKQNETAQERPDAFERRTAVVARRRAIEADPDGNADASLVPVVETLLAVGAHDRPRQLSSALAPIMFRALLKAVGMALMAVIRGLNRLMLHTISLRGLTWRLEAYRSHKRFSEVIREHSLVCRVRQVLLIHRHTGLLLQHAESGRGGRDTDMVSAMLTAIQDFVRDSFAGEREGELDTVRVGGFTVWVEQGPRAILASIVDGKPYEQMRETFRAALDRIHTRFARELMEFNGDDSPFLAARPLLDACLRTQTTYVRERILPCTWALLLAGVAVVGLGIARFVDLQRGWDDYLMRLAAEPGIVVVRAGGRFGQFHIVGLRDPLATDPEALLSGSGLDPGRVQSHWERYAALCPELALQRARDILQPPTTVVLALNGNTLEVRGTASAAWINEARILARGIPGITALNTERLVDNDHRDNDLWTKYVERLSREPGLAVISYGKRDNQFQVAGLRDPLAADPLKLLAASGLDTNRVDSRWEYYSAVHPAFVLIRARQLLAPPPGVELNLEDGVLSASGAATHEWLTQATMLARGLIGIKRFDANGVVDNDVAELEAIGRRIESRVLRFLVGTPDLWPGQSQTLSAMVEDLHALNRAAQRTGRTPAIEIRGHADATDDEVEDRKKSERFARRFYDILKAQNVDMRAFTIRALGSAEPRAPRTADGERTGNCCVSFGVDLSPE